MPVRLCRGMSGQSRKLQRGLEDRGRNRHTRKPILPPFDRGLDPVVAHPMPTILVHLDSAGFLGGKANVNLLLDPNRACVLNQLIGFRRQCLVPAGKVNQGVPALLFAPGWTMPQLAQETAIVDRMMASVAKGNQVGGSNINEVPVIQVMHLDALIVPAVVAVPSMNGKSVFPLNRPSR